MIFFAALMGSAEVTVVGAGEEVKGDAFPLKAVSRRLTARLLINAVNEINQILDLLFLPILPRVRGAIVYKFELIVEEAELFSGEDSTD